MTKLTPAALFGCLVQVRRGEVAAMLWSFAYFFCLLCGYYILRPVRDEMGIQGGVENLQWLFTGTFATMLAAVPLFGWVSSRFPRRKLLPIVYLFFVANLLIFYVLLQFRIAPTFTAQAFFIWVSVFNLFVVSVFWSFMADLYRNEQARRLFGFISAGGSLGALAGPTVTTVLAPATGPAILLPLSACLLLMAVLCIYRLAGRVARNPRDLAEIGRRAAERPIGGNIFAGVTLTLKSPYLLGIGVYVVLGTVLSTFLYFHQAYIVSMAISDSGSRTALFAQIDLAVNVLTLVCQLFVVNRLIARFGIGTTLMVLPALAVVGFLLIGLAPTLTVLVAFQVLRRAGEYAIARPAREILFTVLNRISRAGLAIAYSPARRSTWNATRTVRVGASPISKKPTTASAGSTISVVPMPKRAISRFTTNNWQTRVNTLTARSICANKAVRPPESAIAIETI